MLIAISIVLVSSFAVFLYTEYKYKNFNYTVSNNEANNTIKTYSTEPFDGELSLIIRVSDLEQADRYYFEIAGERDDAYLGNNRYVGYSLYNSEVYINLQLMLLLILIIL